MYKGKINKITFGDSGNQPDVPNPPKYKCYFES